MMRLLTLQRKFVAAMTVILAVLLLTSTTPAHAQTSTDILDQVGFLQNLDAQIPLDLPFHNAADQPVTIGDYFGSRPVILVIGYYNCPNLCDMVRQGLVDSLKSLSFAAGKDFNVVAVSIDSAETPKAAADAKQQFVATYGQPVAANGISFLTGSQESISTLAQVVGFKYAYDDNLKQFAHPAGIIVLTPQGRVSRYFYGVQFDSNDLRLGLVQASANKIGTIIDQILLCCYQYNPLTGKYTLTILNALNWAGFVTVAILAFFIYRLSKQDKQRSAEVID